MVSYRQHSHAVCVSVHKRFRLFTYVSYCYCTNMILTDLK